MNKQFPLYRAHDKASCFNCSQDFDGSWPFRSQNAHGRGAFSQVCEACGFETHYDIGCSHSDYSADREGRCSGCGEYVTHAEWKHREVA